MRRRQSINHSRRPLSRAASPRTWPWLFGLPGSPGSARGQVYAQRGIGLSDAVLLFLTLTINSLLSPGLTLPRQPLHSLSWGLGWDAFYRINPYRSPPLTLLFLCQVLAFSQSGESCGLAESFKVRRGCKCSWKSGWGCLVWHPEWPNSVSSPRRVWGVMIAYNYKMPLKIQAWKMKSNIKVTWG